VQTKLNKRNQKMIGIRNRQAGRIKLNKRDKPSTQGHLRTVSCRIPRIAQKHQLGTDQCNCPENHQDNQMVPGKVMVMEVLGLDLALDLALGQGPWSQLVQP